MEMKDVLKKLREKNSLTQEQMAKRVMVTRQAVSRWETGETQPNTDTLKLLSQEFEVSVNTLLGSPRQLICQCCGMPLNEDAFISREKDGSYNEDYCKWCYAEGKFVYQSRESLLDYLVEHMPNPDNLGVDDRRASLSIPNKMLYPAFSNPYDKPPQPQNKSIAFSFFLIFFSYLPIIFWFHCIFWNCPCFS